MFYVREFSNDIKQFSRENRTSDLVRLLLIRGDVGIMVPLYFVLLYYAWSGSVLYGILFLMIFPLWMHQIFVIYCVKTISPLNFGVVELARLENLDRPKLPAAQSMAHLLVLSSRRRVSSNVFNYVGTIGKTYVVLVRADNKEIVLPLIDDSATYMNVVLKTVTAARKLELECRVAALARET